MAKIQNNFLSSKMNRDKDARLVPKGEYREGRNINVSKSEGANVGALENVLGNDTVIGSFLISLQNTLGTNNVLEIIGLFSHDDTSSLYLFLTTFTDNSPDQLSNKFQGYNYVIQVKLSGENYTPIVLLKGEFLNFSKTHRVLGFNIIENLLFFNDNRNQPRKINIDKAFTNNDLIAQPKHITDYYFAEDQISVAKFAPYEPIKFIKNTGGPTTPYWSPTWKAEDEEWLPPFLTAPINDIPSSRDYISFATAVVSNQPSWPGTALRDLMQKGSDFDFPVIKVKNYSVPNGGTMYVRSVSGLPGNRLYLSEDQPKSGQPVPSASDVKQGWAEGNLITFQLLNPEYQENLRPRKYLEERFARFSYRFKYDDNEYSLMAPFTQPLFVPKQYGSFKVGDEGKASISTTLDWFTNLITSAELNIILPDNSYYNISDTSTGLNFINRYKVKEIQVLIKSSNDNNVYSIGEIPINTFANLSSQFVTNNYTGFPYDRQLIYKYRSAKPFQVLPESAVLRVSDITPVKAKAQEVAGNRVMYANYQNSHAAPSSLEYEAFSSERNINNPNGFDAEGNALLSQSLDDAVALGENPPMLTSSENTIKEHYNSTIKQGRTYQVGVILADRFGRQSNVILANNESEVLFSSNNNVKSEKSTVYVPYDNAGDKSYPDFFGGSIKVIFTEEIPNQVPGLNFYPGLYNKDTNPLGWYSYKIVVKQSEQEYYNVYLPGSTSGSITFQAPIVALSYGRIYEISNLSIYGDNINKIPKNTTNISPTDRSFGSDTTLFFRVFHPTPGIVTADAKNVWYNRQLDEDRIKPFKVVNIQAFRDFGPWTTKKGSFINPSASNAASLISFKSYPYYIDSLDTKYVDPFYNADKNPFIASIDISTAETLRLGFESTYQAPSSDTTQPQFSKFLIVAETNPVESKLDIYWETTSSGLISDLNTSIKQGQTPNGPAGVSGFLFLMEERYPYDGIGDYYGDGKYLLNRDIKILTNGGLESNDPNANIELENVTSGPSDPATGSFEIVKIGSSPPSWNIKMTYKSAAERKYFNPNFEHELQENLTFALKLTIPGEVPSSKIVYVSNNKLTNNKPVWKYLDTGIPIVQSGTVAEDSIPLKTWGQATIYPNPTDPSDVVNSYNADRIFNQIIVDANRVGNSPFIPLPKDIIKDTASIGASDSDDNARNWSVYRNFYWTMSIGSKKEVFGGGGGNNNQNIGKMFENSNATSRDSSIFRWTNRGIGSTNAIDFSKIGNSAVRFNAAGLAIKNNGSGIDGTSSSCYLDDFFDGSFGEQNDASEPYIEKCELAIFDKDGYDNFSIGTDSSPTYGEQGAVPKSGYGWKDFLIINDSNSATGIQFGGNDPNINNDKAWGYRKFPFDVRRFGPTDLIRLGASDTDLVNEYYTHNIGRWVFLADVDHPPFCQFEEDRSGRFRAEGALKGEDICVYRVTIRLREKFNNGTGLSSDVRKVIYVKLVR
jgi:hypothetical protein